MKIALASDHAGFPLKSVVAGELARRGHEVVDFGPSSPDPVDYPDTGGPAAEALGRGECDRAVLICGTGLGMAIVANKVRGVRAADCWDEYTAAMSRRHNDANCLTLGGRTHSPELALAVLRVWLDTEFEGGRHAGRLAKIAAREDRAFRPR